MSWVPSSLHLGMASSLGLLAAIALGSACGANVVVDASAGGRGGSAGSGGHGGATSAVQSVATSQSSASSTGAGPACDCVRFCANVGSCLPLGSCMEFCANQTPSAMACVCNAGPNNCCAVQRCEPSTSTAATVGASSGFGGTGCTECVAAASNGVCNDARTACEASPDCLAIESCHGHFGYMPACIQQCDDESPAGVALFDALMQCAVCDACTGPCAGLAVVNEYCTPDGG